MRFAARVEVMPKAGIADPEGQTIERSLPALGYDGVAAVRVGKLITLELEADDADAARARVEDMCRALLANPVIEDYRVSIA